MKGFLLTTILFAGLACPASFGQNLLVWPGDATNNGQVNNLDFLQLGLAYNFFGPARQTVGTQWQAYPATPWQFQFSGGLNFAFADCNGDGIVHYNYDAFPIYVHYGKTHGTVNPDTFMTGVPGIDPPFELDGSLIPSQLSAGQTIEIPIKLGSAALPIEDFYGIAFTLSVDTGGYVDMEQAKLGFNEFSWANPDGDRIFSGFPVNEKKLDVAWVRTDHNERSGHGRIGKVDLIIIDNVVGWDGQFQLRANNIRMIDKYGNETTVAGDTLVIEMNSDSTSGGAEPIENQHFKVWPNPASSKIFVKNDALIERLALFNSVGQLVAEASPGQRDFEWALPPALPPGIYFLQAHTREAVFFEKIKINAP